MKQQRSLVDLLRAAIRNDPGYGPIVSVEACCFAQDLASMPEAVEPERPAEKTNRLRR